MKRAVVFGSRGQDGRILFERRAEDCGVVGLDVDAVAQRGLDALALPEAVDLASEAQVRGLFELVRPEEIYYLAAHHHSSEERVDEASELRKSLEVHIVGLAHTLEAIRNVAPGCRLFYAGSSQMFGQPASAPQDETTPFLPRNVYAITKVAAANLCALYRDRYGVHASVGILYNHESPLRGPRFVTQRIARGARAAKRDRAFKLTVGSLAAVVDWGYARDYVDAMVRIVLQPKPDDYVIATGEPHTVQEFAQIAFGHLGLDWRDHVEEDRALVAPTQSTLVGNATKLRQRTGWKPSVTFRQLVELLVDAAE
jgi:GDPmannose 4,6-dehydratase